MTALEMKYKFDIKMRELLKSLNHPFNTNEINRLLNESQLKLVKEYSNYFDRNEDVKKLLSVLVKRLYLTPLGIQIKPNSFYIDIPSNVLNVVAETVDIQSTDGSTNILDVRVKPTSHDEYIINLSNPFKQPDETVVWRLDINNQHELIAPSGYGVITYKASYIEMPPDINIDGTDEDCVLQEQVHEDIIDGAIRIAIDIINRSLQISKKQ